MVNSEGCRICFSTTESVLNLGEQALTGRFPRSATEEVQTGRIDLHRCRACGLVQLTENPPLDDMYGAGYGYRSGLNRSMVAHLKQKSARLEQRALLRSGDAVLDIGSNDATLLGSYSTSGLDLVGMDPVGALYRQNYSGDMTLIPEFFSQAAWVQERSTTARLITSIAMFYDLNRPSDFVRDVSEVLAEDGLWHFEQSYLPAMLRKLSYDTICHEHLEYYSLAVVERLLHSHGLHVIDVEINDVNGGSFAVTAAHDKGPHRNVAPHVAWFREQERALRLTEAAPYDKFARGVERHRRELISLIKTLKSHGAKVGAYGASTKGNVLLQHCGFTSDDLAFVIEVNADKFGAFTPGSRIPIVSESEGFARAPDYLLVLPWHFRPSIIARESVYLANGGRLIFPLPAIEVV